jgi:hypothetical protein
VFTDTTEDVAQCGDVLAAQRCQQEALHDLDMTGEHPVV